MELLFVALRKSDILSGIGLRFGNPSERRAELFPCAGHLTDRPNIMQAGMCVIFAARHKEFAFSSDGRREVLSMDIGPCEAETFWTAFLRKLARRGLRGVKLVLPTRTRTSRPMSPRCSTPAGSAADVPFMRNALAHAGNRGRRVVSAFIATGVCSGRRGCRQRPVARNQPRGCIHLVAYARTFF
jgi:hypothetical protein